MNIKTIFSIGVGVDKLNNFVDFGKQLFVENQNLMKDVKTNLNLKNTLINYFADPKINLKHNNDLEKFKNEILNKARKYATICGYKGQNHTYKLSNIWLNEMIGKSSIKLHNHYGYSISGCFYVEVPKNSDVISFEHYNLSYNPLAYSDINHYTPFNSSKWTFQPVEGDIFFWKSDLLHEVPYLEFDGTRKSIAFDIQILE